MQITTNISTRTLTALVITILVITSALTIFLLYQTYKYEIRQYICQLFEYVPRLPTPVYHAHPGGAFHPHPYLQTNRPATVLYHYVAGTGDWDTLPSVLLSQSTGLSSLAIEEEESMAPLPLEEIEDIPSISSPRPSISLLSSPEFPLQEPRIPIVLWSDSKTTDDYRPHSPTDAEYNAWIRDNHLVIHHDRLPRHTAWSPSWSDTSGTPCPDSPTHPQSTTPTPNLRRSEERDPEADEREQIENCDRLIRNFYHCAARPRVEGESSAQYWNHQ
ncbi:uncharacterized protein ARMOST_11553 [Armillaria ostoyae]|uniref:Uncharacterized protein n=1 Tax=Armillaria ostoyae TaxID=47428 RepID=A0A284RHG2_ARMOS|nr:uncharacterized protein ARMOST_11553 [Armillaria ostoyae]